MNFISIKLLPLGALLLAQTSSGPVDWLTAIERWGIAGVWALVAYVLWKKQENSDKCRMKLQEEAHQVQLDNAVELQKLINQNINASKEAAVALRDLGHKIPRECRYQPKQ